MKRKTEAKLSKAANYLKEGKYHHAEALFRKVLSVDPTSVDALNGLINLTTQQKRWDMAVILLKNALKLDGRNYSYLSLLGSVFLKQGKIDEGIALLEKAGTVEPEKRAFTLELIGRALLSQGKITEALSYFQQEAEARNRNSGLTVSALQLSLLDPEQASKGKPYIKTLHNALIEGDFWIVVDGKKVYADEISARNIANSPLVRQRGSRDRKTLIVDMSAPAFEISEPAVFIGGDMNYSHWFLRYLSRLAILENNGPFKGLPIIVNEDLKPYQKDSLALLGIPETKCIKIPQGSFVRCRELIMSTHLRTEKHMGIGSQWLRKKFCPTTRKAAGRRLYISRRDAPLRKPLNEAQLISKLKERRFEIVVPGEMTLAEQIALFADAEYIVAPHGAGLTNILFAPDSCFVLELTDRLNEHMAEFRWLAKSIGQECISTVSEDVAVHPNATLPQRDHDFRINIQETLRIIDSHLPERQARSG